jgi:hypothetical protein
MPKKLPAAEEKLLRFFLKEGAAEEKIPVVAKRFRMTVGEVKRKLSLKRVQEELRIRMEPVRLEQQRQQMLADSVAEVTAKLTAEKEKAEADLKAVTRMPDMRLMGNEIEIEYALMRLMRLDPEKHGRTILASVQTSAVIAGLIEQGNTKRAIPLDRTAETGIGGVYSNLFDRLRLGASRTEETEMVDATPPPEEGVYDLTPAPPQEGSSVTKDIPFEIPRSGESIDHVPVAARPA